MSSLEYLVKKIQGFFYWLFLLPIALVMILVATGNQFDKRVEECVKAGGSQARCTEMAKLFAKSQSVR